MSRGITTLKTVKECKRASFLCPFVSYSWVNPCGPMKTFGLIQQGSTLVSMKAWSDAYCKIKETLDGIEFEKSALAM